MEDRKDGANAPDRNPGAKGDLAARLKAAQGRIRPKAKSKPTGELGAAMRIAVDLVAGLVVGGAIGWGLDRLLDTKPWLMVLFFLLGAAAGIRNVMKTAQRLESAARDRSGGATTRNDS